MASPHEVLGVDADADEREVVAAYRRRVKEVHPDHGGSQAEFGRVKEAYEALLSTDRSALDGDGQTGNGDGEAARASRHARERGTNRDAQPGGNGGSPEDVHVAYLDYEALAEHGWSLDEDDLFEKAADSSLDPGAFGRFVTDADGPLLESAEGCGFAWPYSCRGGACANCAVALLDGELSMPANHVLSDELYDRGIRLSCIGTPTTEELQVVYNVRHLPDLTELLLPERPFRE